MRLSRLLRWILCAGLAAGVTAALYAFDRQRARVQDTTVALKWAHQVVTQVESLELSARERGEPKPLNWAIEYLSQGPEPRLIRISRLAPDALQQQVPEFFDLNEKEGIFDFSKVIDPDPPLGIRVQLDLRSSGILSQFLGTRSRVTHDLAVFSVFLTTFLGLLGLTSVTGQKNETPEIAELESASPLNGPGIEYLDLRGAVLLWFNKAKENLTLLGGDVRDLIKIAKSMMKASEKAQESVTSLKDRIHLGLRGLHETRSTTKQCVKWLNQAGKIIQSPLNPEAITALETLLLQLRETSIQQEKAIASLEIALEPWATDADIAESAHQDSIDASKKMTTQIEITRQRLIAQAKLIQKLDRTLTPPTSKKGDKDTLLAS